MPALEILHAHFCHLEQRPLASLSYDDRRGLLFYRAETQAPTNVPDSVPLRARHWAGRLQELEVFAQTQGRMPRENNRLATDAITPEERVLAEWVRSQRKAATAGRLCAYQRARLEIVEGFSWDPLEDNWQATFQRYAQFIATHRRPPTGRGDQPDEQPLAVWASKNRRRRRESRIPSHQEVALESLSIWTWGK
jgi:hypothetical protein